MSSKDLTQGNIPKQLWTLAWPMMLSIFFYTLYNIVDAYWVAKLSQESIAAVNISQISLFLMLSLGFGITVGSGVIMSMHIGAKEQDEAERVLGQSFVLSMLMAGFFTIIALTFKNQLLTVSGAHGTIFEPAKSYYVIIAGGSVLLFILLAIMFAFNAQGDTHTLTKLFALSTGVNVVLDPMLIFGWGFFPEMGISGAAIATLISQSVFIVTGIRWLSSPKRGIRFHFSNLTFRWSSVKRVLNIGFPAAITQVIFPMGLAALTYIISLGFAEEGATAFTLGFRIEFFAYLPAVGFGFGAMAMIGQNMGAGDVDRAKRAFRRALFFGFSGATGLGVLALILAGPIITIFEVGPTVAEYTRSFLWTVALSYGFLAAMLIEVNAFQAMDRAWAGFWIFLMRIVVITVPLSYLLTQVFSYGIMGVWVAIIIGNVIPSVIGYFWIRRTLDTIDPADVPVHHEVSAPQ